MSASVSPHPQIWWLDPELTYGHAKPFVFTQGHSVCNRSFFPCFDTPAVKCTYSAVVKVRITVGGCFCLLQVLQEARAYSRPAAGLWPASSVLLKAIVLVGQSCREVRDRPY